MEKGSRQEGEVWSFVIIIIIIIIIILGTALHGRNVYQCPLFIGNVRPSLPTILQPYPLYALRK
jgi:hypothetical protein